MNEKRTLIIDAFRALGFELEKKENFGYDFDYENYKFRWLISESDDDFLCISIPEILEKSDSGDLQFYHIINQLNYSQKYIKALSLRNKLWIVCERELIDEDDNLEHIISEIILCLESSIMKLQSIIQELDNCTDEETDDTANNPDCHDDIENQNDNNSNNE